MKQIASLLLFLLSFSLKSQSKDTTLLKRTPYTLKIDVDNREIEMPPAFAKALKTNKEAALAFEQLTASRKKEIVRYLANLKNKESLNRNIVKAINFLMGKEKFVQRILRENPTN